jgi:hypothetical protein
MSPSGLRRPVVGTPAHNKALMLVADFTWIVPRFRRFDKSSFVPMREMPQTSYPPGPIAAVRWGDPGGACGVRLRLAGPPSWRILVTFVL